MCEYQGHGCAQSLKLDFHQTSPNLFVGKDECSFHNVLRQWLNKRSCSTSCHCIFNAVEVSSYPHVRQTLRPSVLYCWLRRRLTRGTILGKKELHILSHWLLKLHSDRAGYNLRLFVTSGDQEGPVSFQTILFHITDSLSVPLTKMMLPASQKVNMWMW